MKLSIMIIAACLLVGSTSGVSAADNCDSLEAQRQRAYQQLRRPHGAAAANRLHARVRSLNERIAELCR
jgi:hypothetical protein